MGCLAPVPLPPVSSAKPDKLTPLLPSSEHPPSQPTTQLPYTTILLAIATLVRAIVPSQHHPTMTSQPNGHQQTPPSKLWGPLRPFSPPIALDPSGTVDHETVLTVTVRVCRTLTSALCSSWMTLKADSGLVRSDPTNGQHSPQAWAPTSRSPTLRGILSLYASPSG